MIGAPLSGLNLNSNVARQLDLYRRADSRPSSSAVLYPVPGSATTVTVGGERAGAADVISGVFWRYQSGWDNPAPVQLQLPTGWTVDITATGVDADTQTGGRVDNVGLSAEADYLVWAFADAQTLEFQGYGITARPVVTGASTTSGGGLGASGTFSVGANNGNRFVTGARVLIRTGVTLGAAYNQGVITSRAGASITVQLDPSYGGVSEANASLSGLSGLEIIQLDRYEPRMFSATDSLYPGSGAEYLFSYVGHIQTDASSDVRYCRRRGEPYVAAANYTVYQNTIAGPTTDDDTVCLARWAPFHTRSAWVMVNGASGSTRNFVGLSRDSTAPTTISTGIAADDERDQGFALLRPRDLTTRVFHQAFDAANSLGRVFLFGWIEEEF